MTPLDVSITVPCMNRAKFIDFTLPTWLKLPVREIIILDWSSTDNLAEIIDKHQDGRIYRVYVPNKKTYHRTKPINTSIRFATSKFILKVDSDILITENIFEHFKLDDNSYSMPRYTDGIFGTCLFTKQQFNKINGYNEHLELWGFEDNDFYTRLSEKFTQKKIANILLGAHIEHDVHLRVVNYDTANMNFDNHGYDIPIFIMMGDNNRMVLRNNPWTVDSVMEPIECTVFKPDGQEYKTII